MRAAVILFFLLMHVLPATGRSYYFSTAGNDAANGLTQSTAWKTISKMYSVTPIAGDSLLFRGGDAFSGLVYLGPASQGTLTRPLVIGSYGSGRATINAGTGNGIFCYNNGGILVKNINITGAGDSLNTTSGIYCYLDTPGNIRLSNIRIDSATVAGFGHAGIEIMAYPKDSSRSGYQGVRISNSVTHNDGNVGISLSGYFRTSDTGYNHLNCYIGHCSAYNNRGIGTGINGSGIELSQVDSATIEYCEAYNNGLSGGGGVGIWAWDARNVVIQHCESHHNHTTRSDGDGFDLDGGVTYSVMQYNYAHDNDGAGFLLWQFDGARPFHNNVLRYNISENDSRSQHGYYGIVAVGMGDTSVNSGVHDVQIYGNTLFKNRIPGNDTEQGAGLSLDGKNITGVVVYNNIFSLSGTSRFVTDYHSAGLRLLNNNYYSSTGSFWVGVGNINYTSAAAWMAATGQERSGAISYARFSNPLLRAAGSAGTIGNADSLGKLSAYYYPTNSSPVIDSGINLLTQFGISNGGRDFFGHVAPMGKGYDIGAAEFVPLSGLSNIGAAPAWRVYPNPCSGYVFIDGIDGAFSAALYDMLGRRVVAMDAYEHCRIDMRQYPAGIYQLILRNSQGSRVARILKSE